MSCIVNLNPQVIFATQQIMATDIHALLQLTLQTFTHACSSLGIDELIGKQHGNCIQSHFNLKYVLPP